MMYWLPSTSGFSGQAARGIDERTRYWIVGANARSPVHGLSTRERMKLRLSGASNAWDIWITDVSARLSVLWIAPNPRTYPAADMPTTAARLQTTVRDRAKPRPVRSTRRRLATSTPAANGKSPMYLDALTASMV